jgi:cobalamin biosynthetic protein CobC
VWQRLPEVEDQLAEAALGYYGHSCFVAVPGTQAVIETLPRLLSQRRVWVPAMGYREHAYCWQKHAHRLQTYTTLPDPDALAPQDVVVVINPNNPTAQWQTRDSLHALATRLERLDGLLVVDEAFMDCTPGHSMLTRPLPDSVVVLRSFGKFFGLAGIRLGFCFARESLLAALRRELGPWAVNHPARWIASQALADVEWHAKARVQLRQSSQYLQSALSRALSVQATLASTDLFITIGLDCARELHEHLAHQGLLTRLFQEEKLLRIGVDADAQRSARLIEGVASFKP